VDPLDLFSFAVVCAGLTFGLASLYVLRQQCRNLPVARKEGA
jgi:hypothetical protein